MPGQLTDQLDEIVRIRMLMIAAGRGDGNDADSLRHDPMFKLAMGYLPEDDPGIASWDRVERVIARVEAGPDGVDTRFITTNLGAGSPRTNCEKVYCQRGLAENHIKSFKTHLAADRTSCHSSSANQLRRFLHAGAHWMMWSLRMLMPRRSSWRVKPFDTLRLRQVKLAVRVVDLKRPHAREPRRAEAKPPYYEALVWRTGRNCAHVQDDDWDDHTGSDGSLWTQAFDPLAGDRSRRDHLAEMWLEYGIRARLADCIGLADPSETSIRGAKRKPNR